MNDTKITQLNSEGPLELAASPMETHPYDRRIIERFCTAFGVSPDDVSCLPETRRSQRRFEDVCRIVERRCETLETRCVTLERFIQRWCPGNTNYSQVTLDEYSDNAQVNLTEVIEGLDPPYVTSFPVPPQRKIRLEHAPRPGFFPTVIAIDMSLANQGDNYLDIEIQFYLGPGGKDVERQKPIGDLFRANQFLNKNGTQMKLPFPRYRGKMVDVGSVERLQVEIRHKGTANNLVSAFVTVHHDAAAFYELCKAETCG